MNSARANRQYDFASEKLDVSCLVGCEIKLFSPQFPGRELRTKILSATDNQLQAESGSRFDVIDNLVNQQTVVLQFPYRGEEISVKAQLRRTEGGRCHFILGDKATPLSQRRFYRVDLVSTVRMATYPLLARGTRDLGKLRWMETKSINLSSGGLAIEVPSVLDEDVYLLINVELEDLPLPKIMLGKVRHCWPLDSLRYHAGVEFVTREIACRLFSPATMRQLPASLFAYRGLDREKLNRVIAGLESKQ
jgi:hypothetical protein